MHMWRWKELGKPHKRKDVASNWDRSSGSSSAGKLICHPCNQYYDNYDFGIDIAALLQVTGVRSNLWQGAAAVASGAAFTNVYVGWGVKTERFLPLPPPPVAQEYDQVRLPVNLTCHAPHHKVQSTAANGYWVAHACGCASD